MTEDEDLQHGSIDDDHVTNTNPSPPDASFKIPSGSVPVPRNKSMGNLLSKAPETADRGQIRYSLDAGAAQGLSMAASQLFDQDVNLGASGLRRIRRVPSSRMPTLPSSPDSTFGTPQILSPSMAISSPPTRSASLQATPGLNTPGLEDLQRFPAESLHSFSFAHQSDDLLHTRQNVLKKSIEFMQDRLGGAGGNPALAIAQARVSGDPEVQKVMDLLKKANVFGLDTDKAQREGGVLGPMTGPANVDGFNVFEKSFTQTSKGLSDDDFDGENGPEDAREESEATPEIGLGLRVNDTDFRPRKPNLRRTYTDVSALSLQARLVEYLAQPYTTDRRKSGQNLSALSLLTELRTPGGASLAAGVTSLHSHSSKWAPPAQAVFRTDSDSPWTIIAANDLACLVFGVTRAEVRKIGILDVVQKDRRGWLEEKLQVSMPGADDDPTSARYSAGNGNVKKSLVGTKGGITAQLLSKAPARQSKPRKAQTDDGSGGYYKPKASKNHPGNRSRGVILCGDVVPIQKRNGSTGSASFWVMEKRGGLIWVLEEIVENVATLKFDGEGLVQQAEGEIGTIWGQDKIPEGTPASVLFHRQLEKGVGTRVEHPASTLADAGHLTARMSSGVNLPVTCRPTSKPRELRVSSFPHIAGVMVLSPLTLNITSANSVFSGALFGHDRPEGLPITDLIPSFEDLLNVLTDEEDVFLVDGLVLPEHSFRRARALLASREGSNDAASLFLRPSGLPARHRDGAEIMVDIQMRVVKSESVLSKVPRHIIDERDCFDDGERTAVTEVVYALWVTYSRHLHSSGLPGAEDLGKSRPITPPRQPSPQRGAGSESSELQDSSGSPQSPETSRPFMPTPQASDSTTTTLSEEPLEHPGPGVCSPVTDIKKRKGIDDFLILEEMGSGAYGQVKLARYKKPNSRKMVLKYVTKRRILVDTWTRDRRLGTVPLEIHVMDYLRRDGLRHPNIVEMVDFFEDDINYYIEMVPHGIPGMDLFDYIELRSNMEEAECRNIFKQVVDAIHHLHTKALVVHRDIKDENVVLDGEGKIKLIDFGSAAYIKNGPFDVFVGTIDYAAPEVLQGKPYRGREQDVWALGILLYTIVYKENPFYNIEEILDHALRVPFIPFSEACIDLIRKMLDRDVDERITITEVMEHEWIMAE